MYTLYTQYTVYTSAFEQEFMVTRKNTLSKSVIVDAGLGFVAANDLESLSFRRLAGELDVTAMALYRYFDNKGELMAAMLDEFIARADVLPDVGVDATLSWDNWLVYIAERMYVALLAQPSWLPMLGRLPLQASGFRVLDACLQKMQSAGFSQTQSIECFFAVLQVLFGAAIMDQQLSMTSFDDADSIMQFPNIMDNAEQLLSSLQKRQLDIGLNLVIAGLKQSLEFSR